jgi:hypothetical protein
MKKKKVLKKRSEYYVCYAFAATYKGGGLSAPK